MYMHMSGLSLGLIYHLNLHSIIATTLILVKVYVCTNGHTHMHVIRKLTTATLEPPPT